VALRLLRRQWEDLAKALKLEYGKYVDYEPDLSSKLESRFRNGVYDLVGLWLCCERKFGTEVNISKLIQALDHIQIPEAAGSNLLYIINF